MAKEDGSVVINTKLNTDGFGQGAKDAKGQFQQMASSVRNTAGKITKVAGVAVASMGAAAIAITKQAVSAYADYEQITGGIETLFKDASDSVIANAKNAFYTVGMSANEYMETVTSFSASLISSLGGDTAKAASVADMALVDMADNANKMGTSLESIKAAYQGFAKQQYMLLDNLKLGYGGTKTEMERLLKDAEKLTGEKYDINNLGDVYNAIHAIQVELGVAGTTAKEAEKTITGAANMTKAAWKDVLTAIGGGGDLSRAINNFVFSVSKLLQNVTPVVKKAIAGIGQLIEEAAPALVEAVASALIKAIPSLVNAVYKMIVGLAKGVYDGIKSLLTGATKEVEKQLNDTEPLADGLDNASDSAANLAEETENAADAAKKAVAGFDELNVLKTGGEEELDFAGATGGVSAGTINMSAEIEDGISPKLRAIVEKIKQFIEPLRNIDFTPAMESFKNLGGSISDFGTRVFDALEWVWVNILAPLSEWVLEEYAPVAVDALSEAFDSLSAAVDAVKQPLEDLWFNALQPIFEKIGGWIIDIVNQTKDSFGYMKEKLVEYKDEIALVIESISAIVQAIWSVVGPIIESVISGIGSKLKTTIDFIFSLVQIIGNSFGFLKNIVLAIVNLFKGNFDEAGKYAKQGLANFVNIFVGIGNAIISVVNNLWSLIFDAFKGTVNAIGGLISKIGSWLGKDWDLQWSASAPLIPTIPKYIPALAKGAVIPPNAPFMAMLGDQKHGTNIEAPLDTIKQALAEVMAVNGSGETVVTVNFSGDLAQLARVLKPAIETENRRRGGSLAKGGAF